MHVVAHLPHGALHPFFGVKIPLMKTAAASVRLRPVEGYNPDAAGRACSCVDRNSKIHWAIGFLLLLPASRNFIPSRGFDLGAHIAHWRDQFASPALCRLFAVGFVLTSVFVVPFNYAGFRLSRPPYDLGQAASSLIS